MAVRSRPILALAALLLSGSALAAPEASNAPAAKTADPIPARNQGVGPFQRTVLRHVYMIDGTGAPAPSII